MDATTAGTGSQPGRMTKSGYAKHRGVSAAMVTKWKNLGRLVMVGDEVDVARSDALIDATRDRARGGKNGRPDLESGAGRAGGGATGPAGSSTPESAPPPIVIATTEDKAASAALKRARLERELGRLVERGAYDAGTEAAFAIVRAGLANLHARIGAAVAAKLGVDVRIAMPIIEGEARRISNELADAIAGLADTVGATRQ